MVLRSSLNFTLLIDEILDCLEWYFKKLTLDCSETLTCLLFRLFIQFKFIKELRTTLLDKLSSMSEMFVQVLPNVLEVLNFYNLSLQLVSLVCLFSYWLLVHPYNHLYPEVTPGFLE